MTTSKKCRAHRTKNCSTCNNRYGNSSYSDSTIWVPDSSSSYGSYDSGGSSGSSDSGGGGGGCGSGGGD